MKSLVKFGTTLTGVVVLTLFGITIRANAASYTDINFIFDNANDLLRLSGTINDASQDFDTIEFDYDGPLQNFDYSGSSLLSADPGTNSPGFSFGTVGQFRVTYSTPFSSSSPRAFDFLFKMPGAGSAFQNQPIDITLRNISGGVSGSFDNVNDVGTASAGDLTDIPTPALLPGLLGFGAATLRKRKRIQAAAD